MQSTLGEQGPLMFRRLNVFYTQNVGPDMDVTYLCCVLHNADRC